MMQYPSQWSNFTFSSTNSKIKLPLSCSYKYNFQPRKIWVSQENQDFIFIEEDEMFRHKSKENQMHKKNGGYFDAGCNKYTS